MRNKQIELQYNKDVGCKYMCDEITMTMVCLRNAFRITGFVEKINESQSQSPFKYSAVPLYNGQFSSKSSQKTPHSSQVRARYGVSFENKTSDASFASLIVVPNAKSYYVGSRYNGTRL